MSTETPTVDGKTRAERAAELDAIDKMAPLLEEAEKVNVIIKPGTSKDAARKLILDATFGVEGGTGEGSNATQDASEDAEEDKEPDEDSDAEKGASKGKSKKPSNPLADKHAELDKALEGLYDDLVAQITAVQAEGIEGGSVELAEQMRGGAVQFLRQCNATLSEARQLLVDAAKVVETNNAQLQGIKKASDELKKRGDAYRAATGKDGKKNEGQE